MWPWKEKHSKQAEEDKEKPLYMSAEDQLRMTALSYALGGYPGHEPEGIVKIAEEFLEFLNGMNQTNGGD